MRRTIVIMIILATSISSVYSMHKQLLTIFTGSLCHFKRMYWTGQHIIPTILSKKEKEIIRRQQIELLKKEGVYLNWVIPQKNGKSLVQTSDEECFTLPNPNLIPKKKK